MGREMAAKGGSHSGAHGSRIDDADAMMPINMRHW
jgi:hypothetical protein